MSKFAYAVTDNTLRYRAAYLELTTGMDCQYRAGGKGVSFIVTATNKDGVVYVIRAETKRALYDRVDSFIDGWRARDEQGR